MTLSSILGVAAAGVEVQRVEVSGVGVQRGEVKGGEVLLRLAGGLVCLLVGSLGGAAVCS